jgi:hypothetical protein
MQGRATQINADIFNKSERIKAILSNLYFRLELQGEARYKILRTKVLTTNEFYRSFLLPC